MSRRTFLESIGLGAADVLADGHGRVVHVEKPITFSGWVFKPDTVKDYVTFYNQKFGGQVPYEPLPWVQYHPTMETRALAGELVDVMYCVHNNRQRWYENGLIRPMDDLPGVDEPLGPGDELIWRGGVIQAPLVTADQSGEDAAGHLACLG